MAQPTNENKQQAKDGVESTAEKKSVALEDYFYLNPMTQDQFQIKELNDITDEANKQLLQEYINWRKNKMLIDATQTQAESVVTDTTALVQFINSREKISEEQTAFLEKEDKLIEQYAETSQNAISSDPELKETFQKLTSRGQPQILKTGKYNSETGRFTVSNRCGYKSPESVAKSLLVDGIASVGLPMNIKLERGSQKRKLLAIAKLCEKKGIDPSQIKIESTYFNGNLSELTYADLNVTSTNLSPTLRAAANEKQDEKICQPKLKGGIAHAFDPDYQKAEQLLSNPTNDQIDRLNNNNSDEYTLLDKKAKGQTVLSQDNINKSKKKVAIQEDLQKDRTMSLTSEQSWALAKLETDAQDLDPIKVNQRLDNIMKMGTKNEQLFGYQKQHLLASKELLNINNKYFNKDNSKNIAADLKSGKITIKTIDKKFENNKKEFQDVFAEVKKIEQAQRGIQTPSLTSSMFRIMTNNIFQSRTDAQRRIDAVNKTFANAPNNTVGKIIQNQGNVGQLVTFGQLIDDNSYAVENMSTNEKLKLYNKLYNQAYGKNQLCDTAKKDIENCRDKCQITIEASDITLNNLDENTSVDELAIDNNNIIDFQYSLVDKINKKLEANIGTDNTVDKTLIEKITKSVALTVQNVYCNSPENIKSMLDLKKKGKLAEGINKVVEQETEKELQRHFKEKYGFTNTKDVPLTDDDLKNHDVISDKELDNKKVRAKNASDCYTEINKNKEKSLDIARLCVEDNGKTINEQMIAIAAYRAVYEKLGDPATAKAVDFDEPIQSVLTTLLPPDEVANQTQKYNETFNRLKSDFVTTFTPSQGAKEEKLEVSENINASAATAAQANNSHAGTISDFADTLKALKDKTKAARTDLSKAQKDNHQSTATEQKNPGEETDPAKNKDK